MAWRTVSLDMARWVTETGRNVLGDAERLRLYDAIPAIWLGGRGAESSEDEWRKSLGYSVEAWVAVRGGYEIVLGHEDGWYLPFLRDEAVRQAEVSRVQRANASVSRGKRRLAVASDGERRQAMASPASGVASASSLEAIETNTHTSPNGSASEFSLSLNGGSRLPAKKVRSRPPRGLDMPRTDKDWAETFAESFWPAYSEFKPGCSRAAAWKAWCAIPHPEGQSDWDAVWSAFEGYREKAPSEPRFRKDASTWLNDYHRNLMLEAG